MTLYSDCWKTRHNYVGVLVDVSGRNVLTAIPEHGVVLIPYRKLKGVVGCVRWVGLNVTVYGGLFGSRQPGASRVAAWREGMRVRDVVLARRQSVAVGLPAGRRRSTTRCLLETQFTTAFDPVDRFLPQLSPPLVSLRHSGDPQQARSFSARLRRSRCRSSLACCSAGRGPKEARRQRKAPCSFDGLANDRVEGQPRQVIYGYMRCAPQILDEFTETVGLPSRTTLFMLCGLGEGTNPGHRIGDRGHRAWVPLKSDDPNFPLLTGFRSAATPRTLMALKPTSDLARMPKSGSLDSVTRQRRTRLTQSLDKSKPRPRLDRSGLQNDLLVPALDGTTVTTDYNSDDAAAQAVWDAHTVTQDATSAADSITAVVDFDRTLRHLADNREPEGRCLPCAHAIHRAGWRRLADHHRRRQQRRLGCTWFPPGACRSPARPASSASTALSCMTRRRTLRARAAGTLTATTALKLRHDCCCHVNDGHPVYVAQWRVGVAIPVSASRLVQDRRVVHVRGWRQKYLFSWGATSIAGGFECYRVPFVWWSQLLLPHVPARTLEASLLHGAMPSSAPGVTPRIVTEWTHLAFNYTRNATTGVITAEVYCNGAMLGSGTSSGSALFGSTAAMKFFRNWGTRLRREERDGCASHNRALTPSGCRSPTRTVVGAYGSSKPKRRSSRAGTATLPRTRNVHDHRWLQERWEHADRIWWSHGRRHGELRPSSPLRPARCAAMKVRVSMLRVNYDRLLNTFQSRRSGALCIQSSTPSSRTRTPRSWASRLGFRAAQLVSPDRHRSDQGRQCPIYDGSAVTYGWTRNPPGWRATSC